MDGLQAGDPGHIGPFRLLGRLGAGGMGRVYLGASPGGRRVAIKVVHPQFADDAEFRRRFAREVDAARRVGGFHTALVVDADPGANAPWMATAYIPGPSLAAAIAQRGPLDEAGTRELGAALAEGLAAIHACGLIHRDLKPSNVILADDGPRIIDFGIAKGADAPSLTGSSNVIGTLQYMSPEQLQGQELTPPSDVFALGAILACAATGRHPFEAPTDPAVITRILTGTPSLDPLAGELRDIIAGCLAKEPGSRPSPAELLARFAPGQARPGGQPPPRGRRQRTALIAAGAIAAVPLAIFLLPGNHPASTHQAGNRPASSHSAGRRPASIPKGTLTATLPDPVNGGVQSVAFGPDGILATGDSDAAGHGSGSTYLWDTATRQRIATLTDPASKGISSVAFGPGGVLATGDRNDSTYLWDTTTRHRIATLTAPNGGIASAVYSMAFGPGGTLATGDIDNIFLWNTATRRVTATLMNPEFVAASSVAFGPGGTLAAGDENGAASGSSSTYLLNTATRQVTATLTDPGSGGSVNSVAFGPGGTLAVGDLSGSTYLWDTATRHITATLTDPASQGVDSVAFGPGGTLATGDKNGSTYLWDTATRHITATLTDPASQGVDSVAFGPGGTLAVGDASGSTFLWKMTYH
jgi:serine/threonine protein kinase